ncbi:DUF1788 domain-containing protein [Porticoccus hydrocarbonoclasticus]|uniref:DUF1788 domain-containing protein n=1 Tax=Porticoccus hydrocarbonoclasticus TaxID=1073414 RepID=UPI000569280E|nr:DUF1788 domain-containing protein [Porticoccus hydrocarbonoclasticus]
MNRDIEKQPLPVRYQHLYDVISGERFLKKQGLNSEVPFFICPFKPEEAVEMSRLSRQLVNRLEQTGVRVLEINLYDLSVEILKGENIWDRALEIEPTVSKHEFLEFMQSVLDPENNLIPAIAARLSLQEFDVLFLAGVGEVFPYIRSHNVLNNLQSTAKDRPTVMFFPGEYTHSVEKGASLDLFGRLHDDKYYRAFNIFHCEP